ncbi:MAG: prolyl oligopeptidase family serine peptidase [Gemmataceae bacterium]|nr:prolyl oligopeptidase family serine peptidase [Gemmataceae bacterium]
MRRLTLLALASIVLPAPAQEKSAPDDPRKLLYNHLLKDAQKHFDARREAVAALRTPDDIKKRQQFLKERFLKALGGFPKKTPLNAKVTRTIKGQGFRVENVIYESRPMHHVTANFYIPDPPNPPLPKGGQGGFPGVLVPCGHSANGKAADAYQRVCALMAQHGMAVLCYDPIGQGERIQLLNNMGKPAIAGSTSEHTMVGVGALLVGQSTATYRIWDGIRSLDYLASRPEVDPKRLGCTGNSGGGTLTAYLMALDERIVCAAPSCYLTTLERLFATIGPQDAEQNITGQVAFGMEHADYITMRAPKPTLMCVATKDFFDISGAKTTFQEARDIYRKLGAEEKAEFFEFNDGHGFSKPRREAAARWMKKWLSGVEERIVEGDFPSFKDADLQCTRSGQVLDDFKGKSAFHVNVEELQRFAAARARFPARSAEEQTKQMCGLLGVPIDKLSRERATLKSCDPLDSDRKFTIHRASFDMEPGITANGFWFNKGRGQGVLFVYLPDSGMPADGSPGKAIQDLVTDGREVLAVELRGLGATAPGKPSARPSFFGSDSKNAFLALHLDRSLLGQRVLDALRLVNNADVSGRSEGVLHLIGEGLTGLVVLHAAPLIPRGDLEVTVDRSLLSWANVVRTPVSYNQLSSVVPGVLRVYDLPELAATIAPRKLTIRNPVDAAQRPVGQAELDRAYEACRAAYARQNASRRLTLAAGH